MRSNFIEEIQLENFFLLGHSFGGQIAVKFTTDYPHSPPQVTYWTNGDNIRFNPNLYKCGKVCVSLLNTWRGDQWTSCQTISSVKRLKIKLPEN